MFVVVVVTVVVQVVLLAELLLFLTIDTIFTVICAFFSEIQTDLSLCHRTKHAQH